MKATRKFKTIVRSLFCILLTALMVYTPTINIYAIKEDTIGYNANNKLIVGSKRTITYVSDLKMWSGEGSASEAKRYFDSIGYTFFNSDLNAGTDNDVHVYIGYKTTENENEAITDIRMLPMDSGYQLYNYNEINDYLASQNQGTAAKMAAAAATFADYYDEGSPKALEAYEGLNLFNIGDEYLTGLGDYILGNREDLQKFFVKMITNSSAAVIGSVMNLLSIGIAPYQNDYDPATKTFYTSSWAERIADSNIWTMLEEGMTEDEELALDRAYNDNAKILFEELQKFTAQYENAKARFDIESARNNEKFNSYESAVANMFDMTESDTDVVFVTAYDTLSSYSLTSELTIAEWFINIGHQSVATFDLRELYPVLEAMGSTQMDMVATAGLLSAVSNLGTNDVASDYGYVLNNARNAIRRFNGGVVESISVWETAESEMKDKYYAYTSDAVRRSSAENTLGQKSYIEKTTEDFKKAMGWIQLAVGIASTLVALGEVIVRIMSCCAWITVATSACALKILGWMSFGLLILAGVLILVELAYSLFCWLYELIFDVDRTLGHSEKPSYVFDCVETPNGYITVRYKSVLDNNGAIGDLNALKQYKWCILAYTKDTNVGSPLCLDESGNVFRVFYGNSSLQNGYDCVRYYGERNVGNTNAYCEYDKLNGCYLHYRTVSSIAGAAPESETEQEVIIDDETQSYIAGIIIGIGSTVSEAKAKIVRHTGNYYTYDYNLTPDMDFATFIGYNLTNDPSQAITDIRIAPYAGNSDSTAAVVIGDVTYTRSDIIGVYVSNSDEQTKPQADALYFTTSPDAGSPITADGLHFVTDFANVEAGWEPVSLFCADLPYDFNTSLVTSGGTYLDTYSGYDPTWYYPASKRNKESKRCVYMYFEPTEKYVGGEKYLSGFYFIGGYSLIETKEYEDELILSFSTLTDKILSMPNTVMGHNLLNWAVRSVSFTSPGTGEIEENLIYTYTYNPKRAISDAVLFQGNTYMDMLPYNLTKPNTSGSTIGYVACNYIGQQLYYSSIFGEKYLDQLAATFIHKGNTYIDSAAMNVLSERVKSVKDYGYTWLSSDNIQFGYQKSNYLPQGLYVARHVKDRDPLKLSDVVISEAAYDAKTEDGYMYCTVNGTKTLEGNSAEGYFHSVYEMKDPYSEKATDLAYSDYVRTMYQDPSRGVSLGSNIYRLFIYLRGGKEAKPTYISSISVGSFSRSQYLQANPKAGSNELETADLMIDYSALIGATSSCSGEVIMVNLCLSNQNDAWYNRQINGKADSTPAKNKPAAYLGISRTTDPNNAITGVILYQLDANITAAEMTINGVIYKCASTRAPIEMNGKNYFLYYTYNTGAVPGKPIEDISIDNMPIINGYATNLCYDKNHTEVFGNIEQTAFIHLKYTKTASDFYNKLYVGIGINKRDALCNLLSQGCTDFIDMDLNEGVKGNSIYLGYRTKEIDWTKINSKTTESARASAYLEQTREAGYDIVITKGEEFQPNGFVGENGIYYYPVSDCDLNDGEGVHLYMYYACPYYSSRYNSTHDEQTLLPQDVYSGFYKKIGFARYDRVPYNTTIAGDGKSGNTVFMWEYIMYSDNTRRADFNAGTVGYNSDGQYAEDIRITMFGQRSDGSIKPTAVITGGFLKDSMELGGLVYSNDK